MYFSLIAPQSGREREAAHVWSSGPYAEHQWLWRFFPAPAGTQRDFLFRRMDLHGLPRFYVVSKRPPESTNGAWRIQTQDYLPKLKGGTCLRFDLRANPVVSQMRDGKAKRDDVVMHEKKRLLHERGLLRWQDWQADDKPGLHDLVQASCSAWLRSRAARLGFAVDDASLSIDGYQRNTERRGELRFSTVDFGGILTIVDSDAFHKALVHGIGPAKAFGCGLLLVRLVG